LPSLERLNQHFKKDPFVILAIDVGEDRGTVEKYVRSKGYSLKFLLDEDKVVSARYGVRAHPMKFLINRDGKLIGVGQGYREWDTQEMKTLIQALIDS
jgi:thiol-disulfide isomerase/thioredoxin